MPRRRSARRKIAVASWRPSRDGRLYGRVVVDAGPVLEHVARLRAETGVPVSVVHVVGKAVCRAVQEVPAFHARVVLGRVRAYPTYDVAFAVDMEQGDDLAPVKVGDVDRKSVVEVARELSERAARLRGGDDGYHRRTAPLARLLPLPLLRVAARVLEFVAGGLGVGMLGQPGFPFGTAFVTNVGSFGLDEGFVAPVPQARCPLYVLVGAVHDAPAAVDGRVVVRPTLVLTATADHRLVDGAHAARLAASIRRSLADPASLDAA